MRVIRISFQKISLMGFVLMVVSAITAAMIPQSNTQQFNGVQQNSTGGVGDQKTCVNIAGTKNCHFTVNSITSAGDDTSFPNSGSSESGNVNSSQSPS